MHIKWFICLFIFTFIMDKIFSEKRIIFKKSQCFLKGTAITHLQCLNDDTSLSFRMDTVKEIVKYYGLSNINLYVYGNKNVIQLKKIRIELCEVRTEHKRPNLISIINLGINRSNHNYPQRCPLLRNTTYYMKQAQFDAKYVPSYLPEYNFTFMGKFYINKVLTFEMRITGAICNIESECR